MFMSNGEKKADLREINWLVFCLGVKLIALNIFLSLLPSYSFYSLLSV